MRSRLIKPSFYSNEDLAKCEPLARLLFTGLWCLADKEGRLEDRPERIRALVMPFDPVDVDALLASLHNRGFIIRYESADKKYIQIESWARQGSPHPSEPSHGFPDPYGESEQIIIKNVLLPLSLSSSLSSSLPLVAAAAALPNGNDTQAGLEQASKRSDKPKAKAPRTRRKDELFDAVAEVTGSDPHVSGSHIGRLCMLLRSADPAYTSDEVRAWAKLVRSQSWWKGDAPSLGYMEKDIGRIRAQKSSQSKPESLEDFLIQHQQKGAACRS